MGMPSAQEMLERLKGAGLSDNHIARQTRISQPTITRLRNGDHTEPRLDTWRKISEFYLDQEAERAKPRRRSA